MTPNPSHSPITLAVSLGVLCGAALSFTAAFFAPGKWILLAYAAVVVSIIVALRWSRMEFRDRFVAGAGALLIAGLAHYVTVASRSSVGLPGHLWRLAFLVAILMLISLAAARISAGHPHA